MLRNTLLKNALTLRRRSTSRRNFNREMSNDFKWTRTWSIRVISQPSSKTMINRRSAISQSTFLLRKLAMLQLPGIKDSQNLKQLPDDLHLSCVITSSKFKIKRHDVTSIVSSSFHHRHQEYRLSHVLLSRVAIAMWMRTPFCWQDVICWCKYLVVL